VVPNSTGLAGDVVDPAFGQALPDAARVWASLRLRKLERQAPAEPDELTQAAELLLDRAADVLAARKHAFVDDPVVDVVTVLAPAEDGGVGEHREVLGDVLLRGAVASESAPAVASPSRRWSSKRIRIGSPSMRKRRAISSTGFPARRAPVEQRHLLARAN
jgi:hypothetical protein